MVVLSGGAFERAQGPGNSMHRTSADAKLLCSREAKSLFNYAIGQQLDWHRNAESACLRRFHINDELK
jgi:hypothetical protein